MDTQNTRRRWYDHDPVASDFFHAMQALPAKIQEIICNILTDMIETTTSDSLSENYRTMGYQRLAAMHLAKNKRRQYDENRLLHNTMSAMATLELEKRGQILKQATDMLRSVLEYLKRQLTGNPTAPSGQVYELCLRSLEAGCVITADIFQEQRPVLYDADEPVYVIRQYQEPSQDEEIAPLEE